MVHTLARCFRAGAIPSKKSLLLMLADKVKFTNLFVATADDGRQQTFECVCNVTSLGI
jgi:hypothetical protein